MSTNRPPTWIEWLVGLVVGHTANGFLLYGFDYVLYPIVIFQLGLVRGGLVMATLSLITCWLTLKFYDWSGRDWLGIEAVKQLKHQDSMGGMRRWLAQALRLGDPLAFMMLAVMFDPFITTVYLRRDASHGMTRRDWRVFLLSWFIGNAAWALVCFGGIEAVRRLGGF